MNSSNNEAEMKTFNPTRTRTADAAGPRSATDAAHATATKRPDRRRRPDWKAALSRLTQPAFRLHEYRNVRTRMLRDVFCDLDCRR
jgi:hypothetical protein